MTYLIYGTLVYSNASNRNTAQSAINSALSGYSTTSVDTAYPAGVNTNGSTGLTVSIRINDADVNALHTALTTAWTGSTRATTGHLITVVKE